MRASEPCEPATRAMTASHAKPTWRAMLVNMRVTRVLKWVLRLNKSLLALFEMGARLKCEIRMTRWLADCPAPHAPSYSLLSKYMTQLQLFRE